MEQMKLPSVVKDDHMVGIFQQHTVFFIDANWFFLKHISFNRSLLSFHWDTRHRTPASSSESMIEFYWEGNMIHLQEKIKRE